MTVAVPENIRFVVHPYDDPKDGAALATFTRANLRPGSGVRIEHNGTGSGRLVVNAKQAEFTAAILHKYNYVRCYNDDVSSSVPFFGFFLIEGDYKAISENEDADRDLVFEGAGAMIYLNRGAMANESYIPGGMDPFDDLWRLYLAGTGDAPGQMIWRVCAELLDVSRPQNPVPDLSLTFTAGFGITGVDSAAVPWAGYSLDATATVKEKALRVIMRLAELGVILDFNPHTFAFSAYQTWGRTLTGTTFGTSKVRFVKAVNIVSANPRALRGGVDVSHELVGSNDEYNWVTNPAGFDIVIEEGLDVQSSDSAARITAGQNDMASRGDASDSVKLEVAYGNDAASGFYRPHRPEVLAGSAAAYWVGDIITVHSGTGEFDWNNAPRLVAAITFELGDEAGWLPIVVELGAAYVGLSERVAASGGGGQPCPCLRLCDPDLRFVATDGDWKTLNVMGDPLPAGWNLVGFDDSAWSSPANIVSMGDFYRARGPVEQNVPNDEIILRKEYTIAAADLAGGAVEFQYSIDNGGYVYVNGVQVASLLPLDDDTPGHYTGTHTTTIARSVFQAGVNCVAVYAHNDSAGGIGGTPPGPISGGMYIEIPVDGFAAVGSDSRAARCDHPHHHNDLLGRDGVQQHPASGVTYDNTVSGLTAEEVQAALDELAGGPAVGLQDLDVHGVFLATYHYQSDGKPHLLASQDGITWTQVGDDPIVDFGASSRDPSLLHYDGAYWIAHTGPSSEGKFTVWRSDELLTGWVQHVQPPVPSSPFRVWAPEWFVDPATGNPHIFIAVSYGDFDDFKIYEIHPTDRGMTTWSTPVEVTGSNFPANMIDPHMVYAPEIGDSTKPYKLWYKDEVTFHIEYAESASLTSGFTRLVDGNWAGWKVSYSIEGACLVKLDDGRWRIYFNENNGFSSVETWYSDSYDDWATWTTRAVAVTPELAAHGTIVRLRSVYDHERDLGAHAALLGAGAADLAAHLADPTDAHDASAVSIVDAGTHFTGTTVEAALQELGAETLVAALDDLTDVIITAPADADRLRYNGSEWVNSNLHWEPMTDYDGLVMLDSAGGIHVHEVSH